MQRDVTKKEIKDTMFSINGSKAPGPDGFPASFFYKAFPVVDSDVIQAIKSFFRSVKLLREVNATIISLVPKKNNPSEMGDFRLISCCNVVYKCIMKVLANRILPGLDDVISSNQGVFIPKSISDNVFLAQELVRDYHKEKGKPRCTLKVDIMKAYDSISWDFILHCRSCFGAPSNFVGWVRGCITSPRFFVAVNGSLVGYFEGRKGLHQSFPICS
jgi:hypothetical protein